MAPESEGPPEVVDSGEPALTRASLADLLHQKVGITRREGALLVSDLLDLLEEGLLEDGKVKIAGFGSFVAREKAPRQGRNPHTDSPMLISGRRVVTFKPSQVLRAAMNQQRDRSS